MIVWLFLVTSFSNPCTASSWPRPLCGPLPLAEVWTGTGNRTAAVSGEVRRWRYLSLMSRCHETGHRLSRAAAHGCCHPRDISSNLLPPFPDFLSFEARAFTLVNFIQQFLIMCYVSENCYTAVTSVLLGHISIYFSDILDRYFVPSWDLETVEGNVNKLICGDIAGLTFPLISIHLNIYWGFFVVNLFTRSD